MIRRRGLTFGLLSRMAITTWSTGLPARKINRAGHSILVSILYGRARTWELNSGPTSPVTRPSVLIISGYGRVPPNRLPWVATENGQRLRSRKRGRCLKPRESDEDPVEDCVS